MIVEDEAELRGLAIALLEETTLQVIGASNGEEALHYLHHHAGKVALLFADVRLSSRLDGGQLARTVRLQGPWIRTVLTSGALLAGSLDKALKDVRVMPKPWRALEVLMEAE